MTFLEKCIEKAKALITDTHKLMRAQSGDHGLKIRRLQGHVCCEDEVQASLQMHALINEIPEFDLAEEIAEAFAHEVEAEIDTNLLSDVACCKHPEWSLELRLAEDTSEVARLSQHVDELRARWSVTDIMMVVSPTTIIVLQTAGLGIFIHPEEQDIDGGSVRYIGTLNGAILLANPYAIDSTPVIYLKDGWLKTNSDKEVWCYETSLDTDAYEMAHRFKTDVTPELDLDCISLVGIKLDSLGVI